MNIIENLFESSEMPSSEITQHLVESGYTLNKRGYRCDEFEDRQEINVVSIGCSNAFGWCVETEERFSNVFVKMLKEETGKTVADWNISIPAKSNDFIARQVINAQRLLSPDIVLVCFTDIGRREYFGIDYRLKENRGCYDYIPAECPDDVKKRKPHFMPYALRFQGLTSPHDDLINLYRNIKLVQGVLHETRWLFCTFSEEEMAPLAKYFTKFHIGGFPKLDLAWDDRHPGPKSHGLLGRIFFERYKNVYLD